MAFLAVFSIIPLFGIVIAFQDYNPGLGFIKSEWVGLDNFKYMFELRDSRQIFWNTVSIAFMKMTANLLVPLAFALMLHELKFRALKRWIQTIVYLPHFLSWVILAGILRDVLSPNFGIVNDMIASIGLPRVFFLGNDNWFPYVLVITDVWREFGFGTIVFLAALTGINPVLYEAAVIDGATRWKQTLHITLPGIVPIIILMGTLSLGNVLNAGFDQVFNMYSTAVYSTGDIIDTYVYRMGLQNFQFGMATAVGLFKSVVSFVLISVSYMLAYRLANYRIF